jgi:DNA/RNA-binding domain of Phe-tRNA-synthetase-like protein
MLLKIDAPIFETFPEARLSVVSALGVDNHGEDPELRQRLRSAEKVLLQALGAVPVTEHPRISAWREAYRKFGAKPKKYPSSIENLARRTLKGEAVRSINKLVDIYNSISLSHFLPAGGEDLDEVRGDIRLTFAGQNEPSVLLLGEREPRQPSPGEVIYTDEVGAICRRWNWKEADRTKFTEDTVNAVLVIEALPPTSRSELEAAASELGQKIEHFCGGTIKTTILDSANRETELLAC